MAEPAGIAGPSSAPPARAGTIRSAVGAVDGQGGGPGGRGRAQGSAGVTRETQPPAVIRFQGQTLDPMAPRGTYLDITV